MSTPETAPSRHDREHAARDLSRDLRNAIGALPQATRLPWTIEGAWNVDYREAKFDLLGPDGLTARITVHVSDTQDFD